MKKGIRELRWSKKRLRESSTLRKIRWFEIPTSVLALIVSIVAVASAIFDSRASREHERISARPILQVKGNTSEPRNGVAQSSDERQYYRLILQNVGLGPAKISQLSISFKGEMIGDVRNENCKKAIMRLGATDSESYEINCHQIIGEAMYLLQGEQTIIFDAQQMSPDEGKLYHPDDPMALKLHARYCSAFYEDNCYLMNLEE